MPRFVILLALLVSDLVFLLLVASTMQADIGVIGLAVMVQDELSIRLAQPGIGPEFDSELC
jgi:hypothetical protein